VDILSNAEWVEISEAAGGLPDAARDEICATIRAYREDEGKEFEVRSGSAEKNVDRAFRLVRSGRKVGFKDRKSTRDPV
jgi:hypothetical protein